MAQIVKLRRSSVSGQKPTNTTLQLGELALNTADGKVFFAKSGSLGPTVEELVSTNTINTGSINLSGSINLEGNQTITGSLYGANIISGSQIWGDGSNLINIPLSGVTNLVTISGSFDNRINVITSSLDSINTFSSSVVLTSQTSSMTVLSSSYALTASYALNASGGGGGAALGSYNSLVVTEASSTWSFQHNTGQRYPIFQVFDNNGFVIIPSQIQTIDENNANIIFPSAQTGRVIASLGGGNGNTEEFINSDLWVVDHNLGTDYPDVIIWDSNRNVIFPNRIESVNENQIKVYFSVPVSGHVSVSRGGHIISGSVDLEWPNILNKPVGLVSGSGQISYSGISGVPSGIVSGSDQLTGSYDTRYVLSGSITQTTWDNIANKPSGLISGSVQVELTGTTGYSTFSSSIDTSISSSVASLSSSIATTDSTQNGRLNSIETTTGSLNSYTSSTDLRLNSIELTTSSLNSYTSSTDLRLSSIETTSGSHNGRLNSLETTSASLLLLSSSIDTALEFTGSNVTVKGDFLVKGTTTTVNSTTLDIGDNIVSLNGTGATNAGLVVRDVTNPNTISGSLLWDSTNDYWIAGPLGNEEKIVLEGEFNSFTSSYNTGSFTGSFIGDGSQLTNIPITGVTNLSTISGSFDSRLDILETYSGSQLVPSSSMSFRTLRVDVLCKNSTGVQINKGTVVRIVGAVGDNPLIGVADPTTEHASANTLGIVTENIPNDSFGSVITEGTLLGVNTDGMTAGALLYLGANGTFTTTPPTAPNHGVRLGEVLRVQQNQGSIYVRIDNGMELNEAHDVIYTDITDGDLLIRSGSVWKNSKQLTGSYTITGSLNVTGGITGSIDYSNITNKPTLVSGSSQITYSGLIGIPSNIVSGSEQLTGSYDTRYVLSGSITQTTWDNIANKPNDIVSSSIQISSFGFLETSSFNTYTSSNDDRVSSLESKTGSYATTGSNVFIGTERITGSLLVSGSVVISGSLDLSNANIGSSRYLHTQTNSNLTWNIVHNLGYDYPNVTVYDGATNKVMLPSDITSINSNSTQITFATPEYGYALVSVGGISTSSADRYLHTVTSATGSWVIDHNLGYKYPNIDIYDANDEQLIPLVVRAVSVNRIQVDFSTPTSGNAIITLGGPRSTSIFNQTGSFYNTQYNIGITGSLVVTGEVDGASFNTTSDSKLKIDLIKIEGALDKIEKLNGYTFNWLEEYNEDRTRQIGMLADEVYDVQPELISKRSILLGGKEEEIKLLDYSKVTTLLIEGIKELTDRVSKLENKRKKK